MHNILEEAYKYFIMLIEEGKEYPDAEWRTTEKFNLSVLGIKKITDKYNREE